MMKAEKNNGADAVASPFDSDGRILFGCAIGSLQAWPAEKADVSVALSFYATFSHVGETGSYTSSTHNLTAADARDLAAALLRAAEHADAVAVVAQQEAA